jgi:hypothetical protein
MRDASNNDADWLGHPRVGAQGPALAIRAGVTRPHAIATSVLMLFALAAVWQPLPVRAEPELSLRWTASSAACPDLAWAEARIAEQLGRAPRADVARGVHAEVAIEAGPKGFVLRLQTHFQEQVGSRTFEGARCDELSEAATLVISLSVSEASEQIAAAPPQPPKPAESAPPPAPPPNPRSAKALGGALRLEAMMQVGLWDRVVFGPSLALGLTRGLFRVELAGYWYPPLTLEQQGRSIDASLGAARAIACALFGSGRVRGGPCVAAELGGARSENRATTGTKDHSWWSAASVGGRLQVQLVWRLSLVVSADLVVGLTQLRFLSLDENGQPQPLGESKPLQLRASLGPELRF